MGLNYFANAEKGGQSKANAQGVSFALPVWRWLTLALYSCPTIVQARSDYPGHYFIEDQAAQVGLAPATLIAAWRCASPFATASTL